MLVGLSLVGLMVVGLTVVGPTVVGLMVIGLMVVGLKLAVAVGLSLVGYEVVVGLVELVGIADVVGEGEDGGHCRVNDVGDGDGDIIEMIAATGASWFVLFLSWSVPVIANDGACDQVGA